MDGESRQAVTGGRGVRVGSKSEDSDWPASMHKGIKISRGKIPLDPLYEPYCLVIFMEHSAESLTPAGWPDICAGGQT